MTTCPQGFEVGLLSSCYAKCPAGFKYVQEAGLQKCVHVMRNNKSFDLFTLPLGAGSQVYQDELARVATESERVKGEVRTEEQQERDLNAFQDQKQRQVQEYSRIQSEYAVYNSGTSALKVIQEVTNSLKPFRPPTAPSSDLEKERKAITEIEKQNLFYVQAALLLVVLALLSYVLLPTDVAHGVAFLLLCVGISLGFFLRK